ncbi:hypothetical protein [Shewanella phaeophyticola]|uniref:Porin n=1 Tax=Shewanella phaeophyticola TaxID=2978345 RepID=A0ABT2P6P5_9GAMM|nr:hypothetical protein [Shewanella sp. KJ10-1]MCT8988332.1 hypothetical protein [Shewanella sp. KJ10-1]
MFRVSCGVVSLSVVMVSTVFAAESPASLDVYGDFQGQGIWQSGASSTFNAEAKQVNLGAKGVYKVDEITTYYNLSAQYSDNFDDIEVRNASLYFNTEYGGIYVGKGSSGSYANVYGRIDIHANNNNDPSGKNKMLYEQGKYTDNVLFYVSPEWSTNLGKWQFKGGIVTYNEASESSDDALVARLLYSHDNFNAVLNYQRFDENVDQKGLIKFITVFLSEPIIASVTLN